MGSLDSHLNRRSLLCAGLGLAVGARAAWPAQSVKPTDPADAVFARPTLLRIQLNITAGGLESLRRKPRNWVPADVRVDGRELPRVGVHLKSVTSFLPIDQKPSFTLKFDKYAAGARLFGLRKIHLNNSVQDASYVCDDLCSELFRRAGVPAARTAWAQVRLNDRDLGLYVLKEGHEAEMLARFFTDTDGNLYECKTHQDIDAALELDSGKGPPDGSDLKALHAAAQAAGPTERWNRLQDKLDVPRFISMMAMESLTCHIDGYSRMQNNYRVYFDPATGKAVFIACGLDQMFGNPQAPLEPQPRGMLAVAVMAVPEGRALYWRRLAELGEQVLVPDWMAARIDAVANLIEPAYDVGARDARLAKARVQARAAFVREKMAAIKDPDTAASGLLRRQ